MNNRNAQASNVHELHASVERSAASVDELSTIRQVLLGPALDQQDRQQSQINEIQEQVRELQMLCEDCSQILPASIDKLHEKGRTLTAELEPEISAGVNKCFKDQPEKMAEALYPVLGPAVRKMIASLFKPGEMDEAQPYEVEQVFLIHRETSLVLSHTILHEGAERDPDLVSGMLDAIRSFVQEAFALSEFDGMNSIKLGDLTIWVEWGPVAILAVVVRGFPDRAVKEQYAETLRQIHLRYATELENYNGNNHSLDSMNISEIRDECNLEPTRVEPAKPLFTIPRMCCIAAVLIVFAKSYVSHERFWKGALATIRSEPGIVIVRADTSLLSTSQLVLLRDPRAMTEEALLDLAKIDTQEVTVEWHLYQSQDPSIATRLGTGASWLENNSADWQSHSSQFTLAPEAMK